MAGVNMLYSLYSVSDHRGDLMHEPCSRSACAQHLAKHAKHIAASELYLQLGDHLCCRMATLQVHVEVQVQVAAPARSRLPLRL